MLSRKAGYKVLGQAFKLIALNTIRNFLRSLHKQEQGSFQARAGSWAQPNKLVKEEIDLWDFTPYVLNPFG